MADWEFTYAYAGSDQDFSVDSRNVSGGALVSAAVIADGDAGAHSLIPGVYRFTVGAGSVVSVAYVDAYDIKNPLVFSGTRAVVCDGVTENINLLPGIAIILAADTAEDDIFEVGMGALWVDTISTWQRVMTVGPGIPGVNGDNPLLLTVKNNSGYIQTNTHLYATNAIRVVNGVNPGRPFQCFRQGGGGAPVADDDLLGMPVTFANVGGGTCNLYINGVKQTAIMVVETGVWIEDLPCDGATWLRFVGGKYDGAQFILPADLAVTDTATIYVSDGGSCIEIATVDDMDWMDGESGLLLTEAGAGDGVVSDQTEIDIAVRWNISGGATPALNMRMFSLRVDSVGV